MELAIREEEEPEKDDEEIKVQYTEEEISSFRAIFDMFDREATGSIDMTDFRSIMAQLSRTEEEVTDILTEFGYLNSKERISFEEFIELMEALEKKIIA